MASIEWEYLSNVCREISAEQASRYDALYIAGATVPASAVADPMIRVKLIARHGVGFDAVDVAAMTAHGVLVTNTPVAVRRPVATAALTLLRTKYSAVRPRYRGLRRCPVPGRTPSAQSRRERASEPVSQQ